MVGINLSGAEFGGTGMQYGTNYIYPSASDIKYYADKGVDLIRLPFKWERMQTDLGGALNEAEVGRLKTFLDNAQAAGTKVIIDLHNYGRYEGKTIGSADVSYADFANFWSKLAGAVKGHPALAGYDIMNEPHDMGGSQHWPNAAQAAVDAIRKVDGKTAILVEGDGWSGAHSWQKINANLNIKDPANNLYYEAHQYFDKNSSGTYQNSYDADGTYPNIGVDRLKPFTDWLKATGNKGFIGEFAVPDNDPRWLTVLDNFLKAMDEANLDGTYWGAGPWWGNYPMALRNADGSASTQLPTFLKHVDDVDFGTTTPPPGDSTPPPTDTTPPDETTPPDDTTPPPGDTPTPPSDVHVVKGTAGADTLNGTAGKDQITGEGGNDRLNGGAGDDALFGGAGNDKLDGDDGRDLMEGGAGNDAYFVDNAGDVVTERAGEGRDEVNAHISYKLGANVEDLWLRTGADINGTGNELANRIRGNSGKNDIQGGGGNDLLIGEGAADILTGGAGNDTFDFNALTDSRGSTADHIRDFAAGDRIDLSTIDANASASGNQAFQLIGTAGFSGKAGELHYKAANGGTVVEGDVNGDKAADFSIILDNFNQPLKSDYFVF